MRKLQFTMPQAIVLAVAIAALAAVYLWGPAETKDAIEKGILTLWAFVSTFLAPLVRKRVAADAGGRS